MKRRGHVLGQVMLGAAVAVLLASPTGSAEASRPDSGPARSTPPISKPVVTKLLVFVEENHSLDEMKEGLPFAFSLAKKYGYATSYDAITHPSLPNYIAMTSGSTYGVADDDSPSAHELTGRSVFGQAIAQGKTAAVYAQGMTSPCLTSPRGAYAVKHNPWAYFVGERAQCRAHDRSMRQFAKDVAAGSLPRVGMVIPDLNHDAHDGTLATADAWFESMMQTVFDGPDWRSGALAVVLTADEDDRAHGNRVLTIVIHPSQRHHVVSTPLDHYSLARLYAEVAQLSPLRHARGATSMAAAFGLPVRH